MEFEDVNNASGYPWKIQNSRLENKLRLVSLLYTGTVKAVYSNIIDHLATFRFKFSSCDAGRHCFFVSMTKQPP